MSVFLKNGGVAFLLLYSIVSALVIMFHGPRKVGSVSSASFQPLPWLLDSCFRGGAAEQGTSPPGRCHPRQRPLVGL